MCCFRTEYPRCIVSVVITVLITCNSFRDLFLPASVVLVIVIAYIFSFFSGPQQGNTLEKAHACYVHKKK